ncbi:MAG: L-threonylcarbamoyladenylate synthase [Candidatus Thalassarchaeaceae archaeon]|nr:L-threonylcarbamoyladenylate synthase [Candidatus Thalassarchaeaceae archaeon]
MPTPSLRALGNTSGSCNMERAVNVALEGGCIVYPTSTQPALGCIPNSDSLDVLFKLKKRGYDQPVSLGVAKIEQVEDLVEIPDVASEILGDFPPGSLTLLLRAKEPLDPRVGGNMVAVRVMSHPSAIALLEKTGPLTATSANVSGQPPVEDCEVAAGLISTLDKEIAFVSGRCKGGLPSTLISWDYSYGSSDMSEIEVLREGVVGMKEVQEWSKSRT